MFTSLDRTDIVLVPGPDGRRRFVQTDHRTAAEIAAGPELSVLFALVRVLNPKRSAEAGEPEPEVAYSAMERPPEFLRRAIRAAGGRLLVGDSMTPDTDDEPVPPLDAILESAFADLARAVAAEYGVAPSLDGLAALEDTLATVAGDPNADEYAYWSAVLRLGGFAGEMVRQSNGGRWRVAEDGTLPIALVTPFKGGEATVNPLGKAVKRFANGNGDSLVTLVHYLRIQP